MAKVKYFMDTEFIEKTGSIKLISIGIVDESGREYYAISNEFDYNQASDWVKANVIQPMYDDFRREYPDLADVSSIETFNKACGISEKKIAKEIREFVGDTEPEFWGYYADYDWVVFCWLFGCMIDLPEGFPMYCKDIKQLLDDTKGATKLPDPVGNHNALVDARWNKEQYNYIKNKKLVPTSR